MGNPDNAATLEELAAKLAEAEQKAAAAEKRHKDTQAAYTKGQQLLKATLAEKAVLAEKVGSLSVKETEELETLKLTDPDKWYEEKRALETKLKEDINQELTEVRTKVSVEAELEHRQQLLNEFNQSHPEFQLTDEVIAYDVPPRFTAQLEKGEIDFATFLEQTYAYLSKPKIVGDSNKTLNQPDLGKLGGGDTPHKTTTAVDIVESYKKEIY